MDIAAWLRELGLERYETAFRSNDIDVDLLSDLTEADLEKLGVTSLGHRKILLRAIEACVGLEPNWRPARPPSRTKQRCATATPLRDPKPSGGS